MNRLNIIILNWNSCDLLRRCLQLVQQNTLSPYKLIIVDNGSTKDDSVEFLKARFNIFADQDSYEVVYNEKNLGFAGGVNCGLKVLNDEGDVCLLNVDAEVQPGWLEELYKTMVKIPDCGLVGPVGNKVLNGFQGEGCFERDTIVPNLHFFCVVIRREVVRKVGLFDTQYGLGNYDDNDYGTRARLAGYRHLVSVKSLVIHEAHQVFKINGVDCDELERKNRELFLEKFFYLMLEYSKEYDFYAKEALAEELGLKIPL